MDQAKHHNGVLPMLTFSDIGFCDVHYGGSSGSTLRPCGPRFNQLVEINPVVPGQIQGDLAESWEVSDDSATYTFRLHDAKWSDGEPVTASDVAFTLDRIVEPDAIRARTASLRRYYEPGTAEIVDPLTIKIPLKAPAVTFLINIASEYMKIYPKHVAEGQGQDDLNCCPENLIGSGPWIFKDWDRGSSYEYEKNPNYFKEGLPYFDGFKAFVVGDRARSITALQVGQAWMTYGVDAILEPADVEVLRNDTDGVIQGWNAPGGMGSLTISNQPPFDDLRIRKAMTLVLDRDQINQNAHKGFALPGTFFPLDQEVSAENFEELAQTEGYRVPKDEDLAEARRLMAEAGFPDGFESEIQNHTLVQSVPTVEVLTEQYRNTIGIDFTIRTTDLPTFYAQLRDGTYPVSYTTTGFPAWDPSSVLDQFYARPALRNPDDWSDSRIDELMALQDLAFDPEERKGIFKEIVDILRKGESHHVPVVWFQVPAAYDYRIQNFVQPQSAVELSKYEHIWWDPDAPKPSN
jgi:peptide/nickel transport system substrate-binding protein